MKNPKFYRPRLLARIAKFIIPIMYKILPYAAYKSLYSVLYDNYKKIYRYFYIITILKSLTRSRNSRLKARLTWQLLPYTMGGAKALENAFDIGVGIVHEDKIEKINILQATYLAMKISIGQLKIKPDILLIDGNKADIHHIK